jgi:hypothetical protein
MTLTPKCLRHPRYLAFAAPQQLRQYVSQPATIDLRKTSRQFNSSSLTLCHQASNLRFPMLS